MMAGHPKKESIGSIGSIVLGIFEVQVDIGFYVGTTLWVLLESLYRIHVLLAYQKYSP